MNCVAVPVEPARRLRAGIRHCPSHLPRIGILAATLLGVRRQDASVIVNGIASLVGSFAPAVVERRYGTVLRPWQRLWISTAMLLHVIGMLGAYERVSWWDHVTHLLSGSIVGAVAFVFAQTRGDRTPASRGYTAAFVLGCTLVFGLLWELLEYLVHALRERFGIAPILIPYSRVDTALDIVFDAVGAVLVVSFGPRALENVVDSLRDRRP